MKLTQTMTPSVSIAAKADIEVHGLWGDYFKGEKNLISMMHFLQVCLCYIGQFLVEKNALRFYFFIITQLFEYLEIVEKSATPY